MTPTKKSPLAEYYPGFRNVLIYNRKSKLVHCKW